MKNISLIKKIRSTPQLQHKARDRLEIWPNSARAVLCDQEQVNNPSQWPARGDDRRRGFGFAASALLPPLFSRHP
jgi:hypothetical protein